MLEDEARASEWLEGASNVNDIHITCCWVWLPLVKCALSMLACAYKFAAEENLF